VKPRPKSQLFTLTVLETTFHTFNYTSALNTSLYGCAAGRSSRSDTFFWQLSTRTENCSFLVLGISVHSALAALCLCAV